MAKEQLSREEAINILTMQRDNMVEAETKAQTMEILAIAGKAVGYAPAFRTLVMGVAPEDAIRWGK